jgi:putative ABC transport system permease protein
MNLLAEIREGFGISWAAIRANKMRSGLTTLGIIIGIVTVTLMGATITGLDRAFLKSISALGADVFYVQRFNWLTHTHEDWLRQQRRRPIRLVEAEALADQLTLAAAVAPAATDTAPVKYKNRSASDVSIVGTTEEYLLTSGVEVSQGRFISPVDAAGGRPVCVLGDQVATNLFQREPPLGKKIKIRDQSYEVIGVLEKQGSIFGDSLDNRVIIPLKQYLGSIERDPSLDVMVKAKQLVQLDEAREELRCAMRRVRRLAPSEPDDFAVNQQDQIVAMFHRVAGTVAAVGLFVTGLSLFVGGIGIMNIMFVSVTERTREIGIRKAIGARRRTILLQFLTEAACICMLGGLIALGIAWPLTLAVRRWVLPVALSPTIVVAALLVSLVTGVVSGFLPAWRAARMNPVDALRSE